MGNDVRVVVVSNKFEKLQVELRNEAEQLVAKTANAIEAEMKSSTSARIGKTIRIVRQSSGLKATIIAGDSSKAIHAGFIEFGTVQKPARPFATPSAESHRREFINSARSLLRRGL